MNERDMKYLITRCSACSCVLYTRSDCPEHCPDCLLATTDTVQAALKRFNEYQEAIRYSNTTGLPLSADEAKSIDECEVIFALDSTGSK